MLVDFLLFSLVLLAGFVLIVLPFLALFVVGIFLASAFLRRELPPALRAAWPTVRWAGLLLGLGFVIAIARGGITGHRASAQLAFGFPLAIAIHPLLAVQVVAQSVAAVVVVVRTDHGLRDRMALERTRPRGAKGASGEA